MLLDCLFLRRVVRAIVGSYNCLFVQYVSAPSLLRANRCSLNYLFAHLIVETVVGSYKCLFVQCVPRISICLCNPLFVE